MKMKKFWPRGGGARPWRPPLRSATALPFYGRVRNASSLKNLQCIFVLSTTKEYGKRKQQQYLGPSHLLIDLICVKIAMYFTEI